MNPLAALGAAARASAAAAARAAAARAAAAAKAAAARAAARAASRSAIRGRAGRKASIASTTSSRQSLLRGAAPVPRSSIPAGRSSVKIDLSKQTGGASNVNLQTARQFQLTREGAINRRAAARQERWWKDLEGRTTTNRRASSASSLTSLDKGIMDTVPAPAGTLTKAIASKGDTLLVGSRFAGAQSQTLFRVPSIAKPPPPRPAGKSVRKAERREGRNDFLRRDRNRNQGNSTRDQDMILETSAPLRSNVDDVARAPSTLTRSNSASSFNTQELRNRLTALGRQPSVDTFGFPISRSLSRRPSSASAALSRRTSLASSSRGPSGLGRRGSSRATETVEEGGKKKRKKRKIGVGGALLLDQAIEGGFGVLEAALLAGHRGAGSQSTVVTNNNNVYAGGGTPVDSMGVPRRGSAA